MTQTDFKVWLAKNSMTQKQVAEALHITEATICKYNSIGRYPVQFQLALVGLEQQTKGE